MEVVSTALERELVLDETWRQDGLTLPTPEAELDQDHLRFADPDMLLERLQRERENDEF